jgi:chromosomal replication initiation ATPase DnaA
VSSYLSPVASDRASAPCQLVLDLPYAVGDSLTDFMPARSNREALDAVLGWPAWPVAACLLIGPAACGKSHLAKIWAQRAGAVLLRGSDLWEPAEPLRRVRSTTACVVDDADEAAQEAQLFHLWNRMAECRGSLLLTASSPVGGWGVRLPDLRSRLLTAWPVRIGAPDDELLAALLVKQLSDRQIRAEHEVVAFLTRRIERSFAAARAVVRALDRASLRACRPITMPLARAVLDELALERAVEGGT